MEGVIPVAPALKSPSAHLQVLVIGAGPVGLFTAVALARRGVSVRVVERASATKHDPRAAVIWPRAAEALVAEGLGPAFRARMGPLTSTELYVRGRLKGQIALGDVQSAEPLPWIVEQHVTEQLLVEALRARGVEVEWGTAAVEVVDDGARVRTRLRREAGAPAIPRDLAATRDAVAGRDAARDAAVRDATRDDAAVRDAAAARDATRDAATARDAGRDDDTGGEAWVESDFVVACDGSRSAVRKALGIAFEGAPHPRLECLQVNAVPSWRFPDVPGRCRFFLEPGGTLLAVPLPTGGCRFVHFRHLDERAEAADALDVTVAELEAAFRRLTHDATLTLTPTEPTWLSRARFQDREAARLRQGRVLLAGDSAHVWAPIGGRGMNLGLIGAQNLAWRLAAVCHGAPDALLDGYSDEHRRLAKGVIAKLMMNRTEYPSRAWELALVGATMPFAATFGPAKRAIELELSALGLHHRPSAFSAKGPAAGRTRAGDRLPFVPLEADGGEVTSHALLDGRWTLLALADEAAPVPECGGVVQVKRARAAHPAARQVLGDQARLVLVRPDAHVALVAPASAPERVTEYLARHGLLPAK